MPTLAWLGWRGGHVTPTLSSGARAERLQTPSVTVPLGGNPLPGPGPPAHLGVPWSLGWGGSAGLDVAESLRGDTCPLALGRSPWRAPGAHWARGPREGSPAPQACRADPGTGRADPRAGGAGAAGRDGAPGGQAQVGSPPAVPQYQDPPRGRRGPSSWSKAPATWPGNQAQSPGRNGTCPRATLAGRQHHGTLCAATHVHSWGAGSHGQGPRPRKRGKTAG